MTDICYIAMAKLHKSGQWFIISVNSDQSEAEEDANKFRESGYKVKVETSCIYFTEDAVRRIWRSHQKAIEREQQQ